MVSDGADSVFFFTITSHVVRISAWWRGEGGKVGHTVSRNFDCHSESRASFKGSYLGERFEVAKNALYPVISL